jgi:hypothetical protein
MRANTDETCHIENGVEKTECDYWDTKKGRRQLKLRQFMALQTKRFHHTSRNPKALFCEVTIFDWPCDNSLKIFSFPTR